MTTCTHYAVSLYMYIHFFLSRVCVWGGGGEWELFLLESVVRLYIRHRKLQSFLRCLPKVLQVVNDNRREHPDLSDEQGMPGFRNSSTN